MKHSKLAKVVGSATIMWWFSTALAIGPTKQLVQNWEEPQGGFSTPEECLQVQQYEAPPHGYGYFLPYADYPYPIATDCWSDKKVKVEEEN